VSGVPRDRLMNYGRLPEITLAPWKTRREREREIAIFLSILDLHPAFFPSPDIVDPHKDLSRLFTPKHSLSLSYHGISQTQTHHGESTLPLEYHRARSGGSANRPDGDPRAGMSFFTLIAYILPRHRLYRTGESEAGLGDDTSYPPSYTSEP
jgi:hypothetical protein